MDNGNNQKLRNVAEEARKIMMGEKLHPNQQKLDVHEPEKDELTADDFKKLRAGKKDEVKKEEVEQIDEYKSTGGVYKHKGTYGTEKSVEAGYTDYDKENELAKKNLKDKPNRKKYGARQNFVRSTRVNESFAGLLNLYKEHGLKGLAEALVKEEPTNDEFKAELEDAKAKAELKKKQPDLAKGDVQAVKNEETEIQVINADIANGVELVDIDERSLSEPEMKKKEEVVKSMKKGMAGFKERYGDRAKEVMYATATKIAKKD
jgi:hypothetical protein